MQATGAESVSARPRLCRWAAGEGRHALGLGRAAERLGGPVACPHRLVVSLADLRKLSVAF